MSADQLQQAVEFQHGAKATLFYVAQMIDTFDRWTGWNGRVHVFDLEGHPEATRAYAWSSLAGDSTRRRVHTALHLGDITSPADAVQAAITAEHRAKSSA